MCFIVATAVKDGAAVAKYSSYIELRQNKAV